MSEAAAHPHSSLSGLAAAFSSSQQAPSLQFDVVHIDLSNKPQWYSKINPSGLVPAVGWGDRVLLESLDICRCGVLSALQSVRIIYQAFTLLTVWSLQRAGSAGAAPTVDASLSSSPTADGGAAATDLTHCVCR